MLRTSIAVAVTDAIVDINDFIFDISSGDIFFSFFVKLRIEILYLNELAKEIEFSNIYNGKSFYILMDFTIKLLFKEDLMWT